MSEQEMPRPAAQSLEGQSLEVLYASSRRSLIGYARRLLTDHRIPQSVWDAD